MQISMLFRTIMIFPEFTNISIIQQVREKFDPVCDCVAPHVTLVFPFRNNLTKSSIEEHIRQVVIDIKPFKLVMQGIVPNRTTGNYLFLQVVEGQKEIIDLNNRLYTGILAEFKSDFLKENDFLPHLTVGKFDDEDDFQQAITETAKINDRFETMVEKISVEIIGKCDMSIIELEVGL